MSLIGQLLIFAIQVYFWIIIIEVVISWLIVFGVVNIKHPKAQNLIKLLKKATDPVFEPVRKFVPPIGGIDLTPLVVILGLMLLQGLIASIFY